MNPFQFHNPTKLVFGEGSISELTTFCRQLGNHVLVVYGGGSIKQNGIYQQVVAALNSEAIEWSEFSGIEPNPRHTTLQAAVDLCREKSISGILAVGGGSVLDGAKAIAAAACSNSDVWEIVTKTKPVHGALPLGTILTLAATGSEMNSNSVITNWDTREKIGWSSPFTYPKFSILDPVSTFSVPKEHTVYGIVDIMSHILEQYMHHQKDTPVQDGFAETLLRTVIEYAPRVIETPHDLAARGTIMYCGTMALNGLLSMGVRGDWATHNLEHAVSAIYDIPHGGGLAILFPQWMRYAIQNGIGVDRIAQLGVQVFGMICDGDRVTLANRTIDALQDFWKSLGAPGRLAEYDITDDHLVEMADRTVRNGPFGRFISLDHADSVNIYRMSL